MAELTPEDRAAIRSYLQRAETRLSTLHRVASALLSGAGLMVLLPALQRDTVVLVMTTLLGGSVEAADVLLAFSVLMSIVVPMVALALVIRDLTSFYFHANHLGGPGEPSEFAPRFTLTGLRQPAGELSPATQADLERARRHPSSTELLVPDNDATRAQIDERIRIYDLAPAGDLDDRTRADGLFALTASRSRSLVEEVAKIEYGMARHVLGIQNIVLRYAKALLALLATMLCVYAAAGVIESGPFDAGAAAWVSGVLMSWSVLAAAAVLTPLRWIEQRLRADGAIRTAVARDRELATVERATIGFACIGYLAALIGFVVLARGGELSAEVTGLVAAVAVGTAAALTALLGGWVRRIRAAGVETPAS